MQWINNNSIWWDEHKLFVILTPGSTYTTVQFQYSLWADLVLARDDEIPGRLNTVKNRSGSLDIHIPMLSQVFEEYTVQNINSGPGWRGSIQLSDSDWFKLQLMQ
jgi:hypothetical protein